MKNLPGSRFRRTHQASIEAILGSESPQVVSEGDAFLNIDRWTVHHFASILPEHPDECITFDDVRQMVEKCNSAGTPRRMIKIASTPDTLSPDLARALIGGAYHEAWHTRYSRRKNLDPQVMWGIVESRWHEGFLRGYSETLKLWANLVEDIRIEKWGNREFPGAESRMEALQDLILQQESEIESTLSLPVEVQLVFRDLGLGYQTERQLQALDGYSADAKRFVEEHLAVQLEAARAVERDDDLATLRIALEVLWILFREIGLQTDSENPMTGNRPQSMSIALTNRRKKGTSRDVMPWSPYTTEKDQIRTARSSGGKHKHLQETRRESSFLISRLRTKVKTFRQGLVSRGHLKGSTLSARNLTGTYTSLRSGAQPRHAFDRPGRVMAPSVAVTLMVDESYSMGESINDCSRVISMLGSVLDTLGVSCEIVGFRSPSAYSAKSPEGFHRDYPVFFDVFKDFHEKTNHVSSRFRALQAVGNTPTGDAIYYGLNSLRERRESSKALIIVTDGIPNPESQAKLSRGLLNLEDEIPIYGLGVGNLAKGVVALFGSRGLWVENFAELPAHLLHTLQDILLDRV